MFGFEFKPLSEALDFFNFPDSCARDKRMDLSSSRQEVACQGSKRPTAQKGFFFWVHASTTPKILVKHSQSSLSVISHKRSSGSCFHTAVTRPHLALPPPPAGVSCPSPKPPRPQQWIWRRRGLSARLMWPWVRVQVSGRSDACSSIQTNLVWSIVSICH